MVDTVIISGKKVGPIGFGMMGLTFRPKPTSYENAVQTMKAALDMGSNFWNGGELYGPPTANSLQLLNHYFTMHPEDASKVFLSIKGAMTPQGPDGSREGIKRSIDNCLNVLDGKKTIDIFECARVDPKVPIEESVAAIAEYVHAGKIRGIGLSEPSPATIRRAHSVHPIAAVEVELSLFSTDLLTNGIGATCAELGIPIVGYAPLSHGFLTGQFKSFEDIPEGDMRRSQPRFQPEHFDENLKLVSEVNNIASAKGISAAQAAISWVRTLSGRKGLPYILPLPGATSVARVKENFTLVPLLNEQELAEINEILKKFPVAGDRYGQSAMSLLKKS